MIHDCFDIYRYLGNLCEAPVCRKIKKWFWQWSWEVDVRRMKSKTKCQCRKYADINILNFSFTNLRGHKKITTLSGNKIPLNEEIRTDTCA